ncbi:MAG: hypothetical protein P1U91_09055 [Pseudophaeobacter sp. bin_em_oilr2.035]|uniref:Uncharacterized protein n=1 Tax=Phaeobacter gallaeciensis TaxID=60890 RepID=A0ABD4XBS2_9RHOB|nr:hypothetical protein [Phaeobacter gallaeciensis]MDF1772091.1 hypothetical protein [Pseudophaeobacter sp. bin_em_oilr2.035]MDE4145774.1 hypothetical protein [Phaeobacter gallaeciensis]MDE4158446.1 hypothetical protein [Phaeobacter gallaeciensis]MDE4162624.1 hypothetical protein [Phaeobacter gallaeciensis]MDE4166851.1 hypothetical protein [Phaeobacter gallaeciensis]
MRRLRRIERERAISR